MFKYLALGEMLKKLIQKKQQLKAVIYRQKKINVQVAYSNLSLILNNYKSFEAMYQEFRKKGEIVHNKYLLYILVAEKLNTGSIKGGGKVRSLVENNIDIIPNIKPETKINKNQVHVRLRNFNSNQGDELEEWKMELGNFQTNEIIPSMYNLQYNQYSQLIQRKSTLLSTPCCVIQSFSSALPPFLLFQGLINENNKNKRFDIIDACSAPGNKTLQLSEIIDHRGTVFAFEKNSKRFETLTKNLKKYSATNVEPILGDFLTFNSSQTKFKKIKLILLDPSCSGSGMLTNFTRDSQLQDQSTSFFNFCKKQYEKLNAQEKERIQSLHQFQVSLLSHAASFKPQRISYSTCSIYTRQNEDTVSEFLQKNPQYKIKNVRKNLDNEILLKGFGKPFHQCIRIDPRTKKSDGFFVCIFKRINNVN